MDYNGLTVLANSAADSVVIGTGTFLLGDNRETVTYNSRTTEYNFYGGTGLTVEGKKLYLVRRLADGNCWMVQNLDLNLADFTSSGSKRLTPENTDVSETWIPGGDSLENSQAYQFQPKGTFGEDYYWGSNYAQGKGPFSDNPEVLGSTGLGDDDLPRNKTNGSSKQQTNSKRWIENNSNAVIPRSYDNGLAYIKGNGSTQVDSPNTGANDNVDELTVLSP